MQFKIIHGETFYFQSLLYILDTIYENQLVKNVVDAVNKEIDEKKKKQYPRLLHTTNTGSISPERSSRLVQKLLPAIYFKNGPGTAFYPADKTRPLRQHNQ